MSSDIVGWVFYGLSIITSFLSLFVFTPLIIPHLIEFPKHSQSEWIHIRRFKATMVLAVIIGTQIVCNAILAVLNINLQLLSPLVYQSLDYVFVVIASIPYFYKFYFGWYRIKLNEVLCEWSWKKEINPLDTLFMLKYQKYLNNRWMVACALIICQFLNSMIAFCITLFFESHLHLFNNHYFVYVWLLLTLAFQCPIVFCWAYTITKNEDAYLLRTETIRMLISCNAFQTISKIIAVICESYGYSREGAFMAGMGNTLSCMTAMYLLVIWPVSKLASNTTPEQMLELHIKSLSNSFIRTRKLSFRQKSSNTPRHPPRLGIPQILSDATLFKTFAKQLVQEFSIENIIFLVEVMQWKACILTIYSRIPQKTIDSKPDIKIPSAKDDKYLNRYPNSILDADWLPIHPIFDKKTNNIHYVGRCHEWLLTVLEMTQYVYNKYIISDAVLCVNISHDDKRDCNKIFTALSDLVNETSFVVSHEDFMIKMDNLHIYSMFDSPFSSVAMVLRKDCLSRFKRSDAFKVWNEINTV